LSYSSPIYTRQFKLLTSQYKFKTQFNFVCLLKPNTISLLVYDASTSWNPGQYSLSVGVFYLNLSDHTTATACGKGGSGLDCRIRTLASLAGNTNGGLGSWIPFISGWITVDHAATIGYADWGSIYFSVLCSPALSLCFCRCPCPCSCFLFSLIKPPVPCTVAWFALDGDGLMDTYGRNSTGFYTARFNTIGRNWNFTEGPSMLAFSDANNWNQPKYYESLFQFYNLNNDNKLGTTCVAGCIIKGCIKPMQTEKVNISHSPNNRGLNRGMFSCRCRQLQQPRDTK